MLFFGAVDVAFDHTVYFTGSTNDPISRIFNENTAHIIFNQQKCVCL